jgi:nicotinate-nucleotide adenylyltransferase
MTTPEPAPELVTGLYGGTFDPVHRGHLEVAAWLLAAGHVQQLIFLPAAQPPHKRHRRITAAAHRLAMLRLAAAELPGSFVSTWELDRPGISYTWDTAAHFAATFGDRLRLIIGMDSLCDLHRWHRGAELPAHYRFLVCPRPGYALPTAAELDARFGAAAAARLRAGVVPAPLLPIAASDLRTQLAAGNPPDDLLTPAVWGYIQAHQLYR